MTRRHTGRRDFARSLAGALGILGGGSLLACSRSKDASSDASKDTPDPKRTDAAALRVVSQTVASDEILWELGPEARAKVVGVSKMVDDARYSGVPGQWPSDVPRVPGTSEALVAVRPDLVIVADFTGAETLALLDHAGIETLKLSGFAGFSDFRRHIRAVAEAIDAKKAGEALVSRFDRRLASLSAPETASAPGVLSYNGSHVAGAGTTFDDEARAAGFVNLAARQGIEGHRAVPLEQLLSWDPRWVVVDCAPGGCEKRAADLAARGGWSATRAAREGGIIPIESRHLYSTTFGMLEVVERLRSHREAHS